VHNRSGEAIASLTLVGATSEIQPRLEELSTLLLRRVDELQARTCSPREAV